MLRKTRAFSSGFPAQFARHRRIQTDTEDPTLGVFQLLRTHVLFAKTSGHNSPVVPGRKKTITSGLRQAGRFCDIVARDAVSVGIVRTLAKQKSLRREGIFSTQVHGRMLAKRSTQDWRKGALPGLMGFPRIRAKVADAGFVAAGTLIRKCERSQCSNGVSFSQT